LVHFSVEKEHIFYMEIHCNFKQAFTWLA